MTDSTKISWLRRIGPGVLVAATGVGAGDLMTASFAGARMGVGIFWAVVFGALLKWALNEGLARWQLGSGETLLEAWTRRMRLHWVLLVYLLIWAFVTGGALINACGVAIEALVPIESTLPGGFQWRAMWGLLHAFGGMALVLIGGFRLFEKMMTACVGVMVLTVAICAAMSLPHIDWSTVRFVSPVGLNGERLRWTLGLIGGVGGTVTLLSYGYWIREEGRAGDSGIRECRLDLSIGYAVTAAFGVLMLVIAMTVPEISARGGEVAALLADKISQRVWGPLRIVFLLGFWGAVFSSLLGVWQGVPYLFADLARTVGWEPAADRERELTRTRAYLGFLLFLTIAPLPTLVWKIREIALAYAVFGALFMPFVAGSLLWLNNRGALPRAFRNGWVSNAILIVTVLFFVWAGAQELIDRFSPD
ncbi:MAG: Nramp family divalent metal transporter [Phycisphaerales bacterium]|nr:Nramp family divalent metal transporter [Phycisphaerales bacterium]